MTARTELSAPRRRTRAEVQPLVAEFVSSGMRRREFCQSGGLSFSTLDRHMSQTRKIITSVAFMRAAAVCPRFSCISLAERAVIIDVIC